MSARFVLVCDVCGAITDDHYPYPVARARTLARALGFHYRKVATTPGNYRAGEASYNRVWLDLCAECMYAIPGLDREPVRLAEWNSRWRKRGTAPMAMHPIEPNLHTHYDIDVACQRGQGPYRVYTALAQRLREHGVTRGQLERLRREMFAADADFIAVAQGWVNVITEEEADAQPDQD
jgi:hypothetical protein